MNLLITFLLSISCKAFKAIGVDAAPKPNKFAAKLAHNSSKTSSLLILYIFFNIGLKTKLIFLINLQSIAI